MTLNNSGLVEAQSGILELDGGGDTDSGRFVADAGAGLTFDGTGAPQPHGGFYGKRRRHRHLQRRQHDAGGQFTTSVKRT